MKNLLNFGVNSPLALEMGHPIQSRIMRLQHVEKRGRVLPAAIGLTLLMTSTISSVSAKTVDIVQDVAAPVLVNLKDVQELVSPTLDTRAVLSVEAASKASAAPLAAPRSKPMRLRMTPRYTTAQLEKVQALRLQTVNKEAGGRQALSDQMVNLSYFNRYEIQIDGSDKGQMFISDGTGGWPGYTVSSKNWIKRPLSSDMKRGLNTVIQTCAKTNAPTYFLTTTVEGDADIGRGDYLVECTPGTQTQRAEVSRVDLAEAWLTSDSLPLKERQDGVDWRMSFALMDAYVKSDKIHTIAADREACEQILSTILESYEFDDTGRAGTQRLLEKCPSSDYNWVRRRLDIPEI